MFNLDTNKLRPFSSSNYLISSAGHDFVAVKESYKLNSHEDFSYMIRTNPKHPMFVKLYDSENDRFSVEDSLCIPSIKAEFLKGNTSKYIFISDVSERNHFNLGTPGWCPKEWMRDYWTLTVGQSFRLSGN